MLLHLPFGSAKFDLVAQPCVLPAEMLWFSSSLPFWSCWLSAHRSGGRAGFDLIAAKAEVAQMVGLTSLNGNVNQIVKVS